jgi:hypothetical protein
VEFSTLWAKVRRRAGETLGRGLHVYDVQAAGQQGRYLADLRPFVRAYVYDVRGAALHECESRVAPLPYASGRCVGFVGTLKAAEQKLDTLTVAVEQFGRDAYQR